MKIRNGGLKGLEQRVLDGEVRAMRALVRQAIGANTLDMAFRDVAVRAKPDGTGGSRLLFTGYACVTEAPYTMWDWLGDYTEIVRKGAFTKTLNEQPDAVFCLNHDWLAAPMARTKAGTMRLSEDETGLFTEADLDPKRTDVYAVQSCMDAGELDAMSFAFYTVRQLWSPDFDQRDLIELDLDGGDNSVVTHPANPTTTGTTALRKQAATSLARSRVPALIVQRARVERRDDGAVSPETQATLQEVLDLVAEADVAVDVAQEVLSELMDVPNPNDDDTEETDTSTDSETESLDAPAGPHPAAVRERLRLRAAAGK